MSSQSCRGILFIFIEGLDRYNYFLPTIRNFSNWNLIVVLSILFVWLWVSHSWACFHRLKRVQVILQLIDLMPSIVSQQVHKQGFTPKLLVVFDLHCRSHNDVFSMFADQSGLSELFGLFRVGLDGLHVSWGFTKNALVLILIERWSYGRVSLELRRGTAIRALCELRITVCIWIYTILGLF